MALINNLYIFVESVSVADDMEITSHAVEKGVEITDHIERKAIELNISGKIVKTDRMKASDILSKIKQLKNSGSLITYVGRNALSNMQIQSFSTSHPNTNWGGCDFEMTLKEIRIAKPAYVAPQVKEQTQSVGTQQVEKGENQNVYHTVKKGDTVWNLVSKQYKSLEPKFSNTMQKCNWIMEQNPAAFSKKEDFTTLQTGKSLLVGYRK